MMSINKLSPYSLVASSDDTAPNFVQPSPQSDKFFPLSLQTYSFNPRQMQTRPKTPASTNVLCGDTVFRDTSPLMPNNPFIPDQAQARTNMPALWDLDSNTSYDGSSTPALSHELNAGNADRTAGFAVHGRGSTTGTINSGFKWGAQPAEEDPWRNVQHETTTMYPTREEARLKEENLRCCDLIKSLRQEISEMNGQAMQVRQLALGCWQTLKKLHPGVSSLGELDARVTALEVQVALMDREVLGEPCGEELDDKGY